VEAEPPSLEYCSAAECEWTLPPLSGSLRIDSAIPSAIVDGLIDCSDISIAKSISSTWLLHPNHAVILHLVLARWRRARRALATGPLCACRLDFDDSPSRPLVHSGVMSCLLQIVMGFKSRADLAS